MADLASLDEDALRAKLDTVDNYEERAAIRKLLRDKKKAQSGGSSGTRRGTVGYNRFAGTSGRHTPEPKKQLYVRADDNAPPPSFRRKSSSSSDTKVLSPTSKTYSSPPPPKLEPTPPPKSEPTPSPQPETPPPREETPPPKPRTPTPPPVEDPPKEDTPPPRSPTPEQVQETEEVPPDEEAPYSPPPSPVSNSNENATDEPSHVDTPDDTDTQQVEASPSPDPPSVPAPQKDEVDGQVPFKVQLRATEKPAPAKPRKTEPQNELEGFKLRKTTPREVENKRTTTRPSGHDFGVKLKSSTTDSIGGASKTTPSQRQRSYTTHTPSSSRSVGGGDGGGSPKSLADFQRLANKSSNTTSEESKLIAYVNTALVLNPPLTTADAFYNTCGRPSVLCNLINKSVRNTVDMRALTTSPPPSANKMEKLETLEENMTLVVESARAIGCQINDDTEDKLVAGDRATIRHIVFELVKSRLVHTPGMDEADPSTFTVLAVMMDKLGITTDEQDGGTATKEEESLSWRDKDFTEKRAKREEKKEKTPPKKTTWKETPSEPASVDLNKASLNTELTYEERAAIRKAEREKRKREREALATAN